MVILDGCVLAVGGNDDSIEEYNPKTNTWQFTLKSLDLKGYFGYYTPAVVVLDELLYFIGTEQISVLSHMHVKANGEL